MYPVLLSLSVIATAIGVFAIGFGIPIHEFSLGNTLIVAGTVAVMGGMILLGLASAVRQLRRIADGLGARPAPRRLAATEGVDVAAVTPPRSAPGPRIPYPPKPNSDVRPPEMPAVADDEEEEEEIVERPRPNILGAARPNGAAAMMEEAEPVAPSPTRAPTPPPVTRAVPLPRPEPVAEPKPTPAEVMMARLSNLAATTPQQSQPVARPEPARVAPPAPEERPAEPRARPNMFDALWPAEVRASRKSQPEAIARATRPEPRPEPKLEARPEPRLEPEPRPLPRPEVKAEARPDPRLDTKPELKPQPRFEAPRPRERVEPAVNVAPRDNMMPPPSEPRPIAILKSGVIDGMAYTLYTDGSIEAELPQGTMRFGSIDELRAHLEQAERQG